MRSKLVKQKPVVISAEIFASDRLTSLTRAGEILEREPLAERQNMKRWIFSQNDLGRVFDVLMIRRKMIANPTLVVEVGKVRSAFMGKTVPVGGTNIAVGLTMRMKAFRGETNTDLFLGVTDTEVMTGSNEVASAVVRTNIHVGARVQVPPQHRVLFVCDRKDGKGPVCVFVSATWLP